MSKFIEITDYDASIHTEILDAVTRKDAAIVEICEDRAIAEMTSYLNARYDTQALFNAQGEDRNTLVLMMAIDITIYHLFSIHNPRNISPIRVSRYERALEWLKNVNACKISIPDAPLLPEEVRDANAPSVIVSNPKRTQYL